MNHPSLCLIVAVADNGVIGFNGSLPWRVPGDHRLFRSLTMGETLLVGRKTYESLSSPLHGRRLIILSKTLQSPPKNAMLARSFPHAFAVADDNNVRRLFIAGGAALYRAALPIASQLFLSRIHLSPKGDAFFPHPLPPDNSWTETIRESHPAPSSTNNNSSTINNSSTNSSLDSPPWTFHAYTRYRQALQLTQESRLAQYPRRQRLVGNTR